MTANDAENSGATSHPSRGSEPGSDPPPGLDLFEAWKEYEKVAMHFNDLLIRLRTQSLAAVAAFAAIAGVLLKGESIGEELRWGTLAAVFIVLSALWIAVWILDFAYYNRLLLGAVKSLLEIEKASKTGSRVSGLSLSTDIEAAVRQGNWFSLESWDKAKGRWAFYIIVLLMLLTGVVVSIERLGGPSELMRAIRGQSTPASSNQPQPTAPTAK